MAYISSNSISVFPTTRRTIDFVGSRLATEEALTGQIRNLIDYEGFVHEVEDRNSNTTPFIFNIHGYYFNVSNQGVITEQFTNTDLNIFAIITLELGNDNNDTYTELMMGDVDNGGSSYEYRGVEFRSGTEQEIKSYITTTESESSIAIKMYYLHILERESSEDDWTIPEKSKFIFFQNVVDISLIDGGIIE